MSQARAAPLVTWLPAVCVLGAIAGRRWWQLGPLPTGLDGGQWLALGRGLLGPGRSTDGAYPPLVPLLVHAGRSVLDPMTGLRVVAVASLVTVIVAVYVVARHDLGPWWGLFAATLVGSASALAEPVAFGGYPQLVALACLVLGAWAFAGYLSAGRPRHLAGAAVAFAGVAVTHLVSVPLAAGAAVLVWLTWLTTGPPRRAIARRTLGAAMAALVAAAAGLPTALAFRAAGYDPPLRASGFGLWEAYRYAVRESPWLWSVLLIAGVVSLALAFPTRRSPTWQVATALTGVGLVTFLPTAEVRLLPPLLTGASLGLAIGLRRLHDRLRASRWSPAPLAAAVTLLFLLWPAADRQAATYFRYYRVVDPSLLAAAAAIEAHGDAGLVVVRHDRRGWPIGWWFEGLTTAPIAVGSDRRWLGFPDEVARAELAGRFFDQRLTGRQLAALAEQTGVDLLVVRKWEWIGWQRWLEQPEPAVTVLYDDDRFLILQVARGQQSGDRDRGDRQRPA